MSKGRLEAFSDGVLAILITIMVLELKVPQGTDIAALRPLIPIFASYALRVEKFINSVTATILGEQEPKHDNRAKHTSM